MASGTDDSPLTFLGSRHRGTVGLGRKGCATTQIKKYVACDSLKNQFSIKIVGFPSFIQMPNIFKHIASPEVEENKDVMLGSRSSLLHKCFMRVELLVIRN
ncbi:hypothetical protein L1887_08247 [Cichorium endivia]|nr:hypothetical protein L1887_08247 [Cichorium endivia]